jgi:hypothetical protein
MDLKKNKKQRPYSIPSIRLTHFTLKGHLQFENKSMEKKIFYVNRSQKRTWVVIVVSNKRFYIKKKL